VAHSGVLYIFERRWGQKTSRGSGETSPPPFDEHAKTHTIDRAETYWFYDRDWRWVLPENRCCTQVRLLNNLTHLLTYLFTYLLTDPIESRFIRHAW